MTEQGSMRDLARRALDAQLDLLIDSASEYAIFLLDADGKVVIWNIGAERMFGWRESEIVGTAYDILFEPRDREAGQPRFHLNQAQNAGASRERSWRLRKDGSGFLADVTISRILDEAGTVVAFGKVVRDITEENARASEIDASEALVRSILDTVPDAMITIDEQGTVLSFSATAERLFGYAPAEVVGRNVAMLMPTPDATQHDAYLANYRATGERHIIGVGRRVLGRRKDGSTCQLKLNVGEARGGGSRIFAGFLRDLSAEEEAERKLREAQAELIHISRVSAVGTMATALAHDLNQPLAAIANYVQTSAALLSSSDEATLAMVRGALVEAGREALRAGAIVHRLRDFIARGELERAIVTPRDLATEACALGAIDGTSRGIRCTVAIPDDLPSIMVDRIQIQQVLVNLIRNAFEALADTGTIVVSACRDGAMIRMAVTDNGPGIGADRLQEVFHPFVSSKSAGMGLGLAICRTIVEAHGGRLWCESAPGSGASFQFTVPIAEGGNG